MRARESLSYQEGHESEGTQTTSNLIDNSTWGPTINTILGCGNMAAQVRVTRRKASETLSINSWDLLIESPR